MRHFIFRTNHTHVRHLVVFSKDETPERSFPKIIAEPKYIAKLVVSIFKTDFLELRYLMLFANLPKYQG